VLGKFAARSDQPELIDGTDYSVAEYLESLEDLRRVNRRLGGRRALARELFPLLAARSRDRLRLLDVGTGSADLPEMIVEWARARGIALEFVAIDINGIAARAAYQSTRGLPGISVVQADALDLPFPDRSFDIVTASLFLHHFETRQAARLLSSLARAARDALIINDLRRAPVAYYAIKALTRLFTRNRLVRHDAALSVLRGFTEADLEAIAREAGLAVRMRRRFPYRLILIGQGAEA
jgi:2-polyprenyl-3-methyl-5-hydroxy-6-metoxy-1,4-benzoquinol methylase